MSLAINLAISAAIAAGLLGPGQEYLQEIISNASSTASSTSVRNLMEDARYYYMTDGDPVKAIEEAVAETQPLVNPSDRDIQIIGKQLQVTINGSCSSGEFYGDKFFYRIGDC